MNRLSIGKRARIIGLLAEGHGLRSISRFCEVSPNTVAKLLAEIGRAAIAIHDAHVHDLFVRRIECNQIWTFGGMGGGRNTREHKGAAKDVWTWVAVEPESTLCLNYLVGSRSVASAWEFIQGCSLRLGTSVCVMTNGDRVWLEPRDGPRGVVADFRNIHGEALDIDRYTGGGTERGGADRREPNQFVESSVIIAPALPREVLPTPGCGQLAAQPWRRLQGHVEAVAFHLLIHNFGFVHPSLGVSPAMAVGIADHVWNFEEIAVLHD